MAIDPSPGRRRVDVRAVPPFEAGAVLSRRTNVVGNLLVMGILVAFWASLAGLAGGLFWAGLIGQGPRRPPDPHRLAVGLGLAVACLPVLVVSGYVGLKNSGVPGNLYYQWLARRQVARRRNRVVDPDRPGVAAVWFVQVVPRRNWGRLMLETATDTGFLQIDPRRREVRFEGDREQFVIPADALTGCEVEDYGATKSNAQITYSVVVLRGHTAQGPWEAPISQRQTRWFVPPDHRRRAADAMRDQIRAMLPAGWTPEEPTGDDLPDEVFTPSLDALIAPPPPARTGGSGVGRVGAIALAIALGVWRGWSRHHPRGGSNVTGPTVIEPGGTDDPSLPLVVTNVRRHQAVTAGSPFVTTGGDWTVFTCAPPADPAAAFTVAVRTVAPAANASIPVAFSQVQLLPTDPRAGGRLVTALARALGHAAPPTTRPAVPLRPLTINAAVLGEHLGGPETGLRSGGGTWVATKWFLAHGETDDAEIFFNYDLTSGRAVFGEKDADDDDDVLAALGDALRDGPGPTTAPAVR